MRHDEDTPALIARAADPDDVACVMQYASEKGIPVAIRSGGHSSDGTAMPDGALVLDMTAMTKLTVDKSTSICRAESGVLFGQLDAGTQAYGLVVPAGTVSTTGVAGLTIGGGVGYNMRRYGATVDSLIACDVVTADGRKVRATKSENADLLWALSGGGGNFGVVTAFEFQAHPVGPQVFSGVIVFPVEQAGDVLLNMAKYMPTAPRELAVIAAGTACPPFPPVPAKVHGTPVQMLLVVPPDLRKRRRQLSIGWPASAIRLRRWSDRILGSIPIECSMQSPPTVVEWGAWGVYLQAGRNRHQVGGQESNERAGADGAPAQHGTKPLVYGRRDQRRLR